jgi:TetR/AcrR family fatty acid metabolism transcriptional regulator
MQSKKEPSFIERARRDQILSGAIAVLAESGYQGASLSVIAERIGVSKGVLSYYFDGKDDLLRQVVSTVVAQAAEFMAARLGQATSSRAALGIYVSSNLEFLAAHRSSVHALVEVLTHVRAEDGGSPLYATANADAVDQLAALLKRGQKDKEFGRFDARVAAVSIRASIDAVTTLLRADPDLDIAKYSRELVALIERGVRP